MRTKLTLLILGLGASALGGACTEPAPAPDLEDSPPEGLEWGEGGPSFLTAPIEVEPYVGEDATVLEAQERLPTGSDLHSEVILRSCGPLGGVCHNRKEYPDMRTPANFLDLIGAPCNVQSGTPEGVFDRCERVGDRITFDGSKSYEIGWLEYVPGDLEEGEDASAEMPGLHIHLANAVGDEVRSNYTNGRFFRSFVNEGEVTELGYATYRNRWHKFDDGKHLVAEVPGYRVEAVTQLLQIGIEQGDLNRNGVYGSRPNEDGEITGGISMIEAGDPETSYLISRLRGHMQGEEVPGSRMPLANPPFSVAEMISLFCFVEGIEGTVNLESEIDYKNCSYSDPELYSELAIEGAGKNWSDRVQPLLEANCGGCHSADRAEGGLVLVGDGVYDHLLNESSLDDPMGRTFVVPGDPANSYLYLKLTGHESITGKPMPIDPLLGTRTLGEDELLDIESWITDDAPP